MREWLCEVHRSWFLIEVVGKVNTKASPARHPNDGVGRPAYDPGMMLTLLVCAYCEGVRSSRRIEQLWESAIAYPGFRSKSGVAGAERPIWSSSGGDETCFGRQSVGIRSAAVALAQSYGPC
ncbi:MAG: transposase [Candidatus Dormibacteria bacterium]